jgi:hypothetical protein
MTDKKPGFHDLPVLDVQELAKCLGVDKWPEHYKFHTRQQRLAARVITDALRDHPSPEAAMANAIVWINSAYDWGREEGRRFEREGWNRRIAKLFELDVKP